MMQEIIDVPSDVSEFAHALAADGVKTVIRYYNHSNGARLPTKCLTRAELNALHAADISVVVVFEQGGGASGQLDQLTSQTGVDDAERALALAEQMEQPVGSAIYFAVDFDYFRASELDQIAQYFTKVRATIANRFRIGIYGSGAVGRHLKDLGLVDLVWLAGATGWTGTRNMLVQGDWAIFQKALEKTSGIGGFDYDGNVLNPSLSNFGQFGAEAITETPRAQGSAALFRVIARPGLHLRAGPGESFQILETLDTGTVVIGLGQTDSWLQVDVEGNGQSDGFMSLHFLEPVSGGLPIPPQGGSLDVARRPIDIARAEMNLGVVEFPGAANNPRIVMYHSTTMGGAAPDETAWCSSFVNYCVEQAGLHGTRSKAARSWHDQSWGNDVTSNPGEGDIVVFSRHGPTQDGGHVGFYLSQDDNSIQVLGGNQGNRVSIARYPKDGMLGSTRYRLLSIRRG